MRPLALLLLTFPAASAPGFDLVEVPEFGLRVAKGFEVTLYADDALAGSVYSMTLDPAGRVVVSSKGFIKRLLDTDGDGRVDKDEQIAKSKAGAMGLLFLDETTLLTTEGGAFNRYTDADGDGQIDPKPEKIAQFGGGEHGAHAMRLGADGHVYLIGGNDAKFTGHDFVAESEELEGGALLRINREFSGATAIAQGFRNPYDFDVTTTGEVLCYDSDCEREFPLPWYSPTRLYEIEIGGHHGWRLKGWKRGYKRPDYYFDSVTPLVNVGRGSPTGVAVYRHGAFPHRFHDGVFYADWTFGKIFFTQPADAMLEFGEPKADVFIESTGTNGFAPTDIVVAHDGSLFISMGGRGTSGSVFHIRAKQPRAGAKAEPAGVIGGRVFRPPPATNLVTHTGVRHADAMARTLDDMTAGGDREESLAVLRWMMKSLGDWNLHGPSKELFTAYELADESIFEEQHEETLMRCRIAVRPLLHSLDDDERREAARLLAMLRDPHPITATRLLDAISEESDPTEDFHYLACLARVAAPLNRAESERVAVAILALDGKFAGRHLRSKQTYSDRLNELVASIAERQGIFDREGASVYSELSRRANLVRPGHAKLVATFPELYRSGVAQSFGEAMRANPGAGWEQESVELLGHLPLEGVADLLRDLAAKPQLASACAKALAKAPEESDRELFLRTSTLAGLEKLEPRADTENLLPLFRASDEKRALKLIARAAGQEFADRKAAESWLEKEKPEIASALGFRAGKGDWKKAAAEAAGLEGDADRGATVFVQRACATCHAAGSALGPALAGAAKRLSAADLFKAIAEPNADVPEAYRATVFTMADGATHVGRVAFSSADGVIVQTAAGTVRIDEGDIAKQEEWSRSLMPEGLLDGLSATEMADLRAYLGTL